MVALSAHQGHGHTQLEAIPESDEDTNDEIAILHMTMKASSLGKRWSTSAYPAAAYPYLCLYRTDIRPPGKKKEKVKGSRVGGNEDLQLMGVLCLLSLVPI